MNPVRTVKVAAVSAYESPRFAWGVLDVGPREPRAGEIRGTRGPAPTNLHVSACGAPGSSCTALPSPERTGRDASRSSWDRTTSGRRSAPPSSPDVWGMPICSAARGGWGRPPRRASSRWPSTAGTVKAVSHVAGASRANASGPGGRRSMSSRSTRRATAASTMRGTFVSAPCTLRRARRATRSTSSMRHTCSRGTRGTRSSRFWRSLLRV